MGNNVIPFGRRKAPQIPKALANYSQRSSPWPYPEFIGTTAFEPVSLVPAGGPRYFVWTGP